jgi:phosphopantothenoylcysteine synthetase/decarboxylase
LLTIVKKPDSLAVIGFAAETEALVENASER